MQEYVWGHSRRYNDFHTVFRKIFGGEKIQKISLEAGFSCPNRDGSRGKGGCTYCNNKSFTPRFTSPGKSVTLQLEEGIRFFSRKYEGMKFLAYFQPFSNTYAPPDELKAVYGEALKYPGIVGLVIATRPDCLNDEILDYLKELSERIYLMLELGVESHLDRTLESINRGHSFRESVMALEAAKIRGIRTTAHMILGLPGESRADCLAQATVLSRLPVDNLKLHQLQIHKGTVMARRYRNNPGYFHLFTAEDYAGLVVEYLELLNPRITIERFTSQAPPGLLVAPDWGLKNYEFTGKVNKLLARRDTWQGKLWNP